jgi:hypothetical protein
MPGRKFRPFLFSSSSPPQLASSSRETHQQVDPILPCRAHYLPQLGLVSSTAPVRPLPTRDLSPSAPPHIEVVCHTHSHTTFHHSHTSYCKCVYFRFVSPCSIVCAALGPCPTFMRTVILSGFPGNPAHSAKLLAAQKLLLQYSHWQPCGRWAG